MLEICAGTTERQARTKIILSYESQQSATGVSLLVVFISSRSARKKEHLVRREFCIDSC